MKRVSYVLLLAVLGCDADTETSEASEIAVPDTYAFNSRFDVEASSVAYGGQVFRHALLLSMAAEMDQIAEDIEAGTVFEPGVVASRLAFFYDFDPDTSGEVRHRISTSPAPLQATWAELGGADLVSKTAGNDAAPQHRDWNTDLIGWDGTKSPEGLVRELIDRCDALAVAFSSGEVPTDPNGSAIPVWYVSPEGIDHQQLLQKFLLGAVAYSQGTDDYLDEGLSADNTEADGDNPYTALEHQWDEGFGYWGGARDYLAYTDDEIAGADGRPEFSAGHHDTDADGAIDLGSENNVGASVNAAKRDRGAAALGAPTDLTARTMDAFLRGRAIITDADGELSPSQRADLEAQRDAVLDGWERAIAATAVHYFNETLRDMTGGDYDFVAHAKHWSELKGFLLMLQFNPRSQVSREVLISLHDAVGLAPVVPPSSGGNADVDAYAAALVSARDTLADAYGFDAALRGDAAGEGGW